MTDYDALRKAAEGATPGPWVVFDMDETDKHKDAPMNEPGEGWYWVWAEHRLPYYGGVFEPEKHHPDCGAAIGEAKIVDGVGGKQEFADATYIAAASPDVVLALLDEVEALRDALTSARKALDPEEFECGRLGLPCTSVTGSDSWCRACRLRVAFQINNDDARGAK